jgi:type IV secretory pathway VirJ component
MSISRRLCCLVLLPLSGLASPGAAATPSFSDLPLLEQPVRAGCTRPAILAFLLSGDGGWASIDRKVAATFVQRGIPVVGLDSLRYFWHERTPEETARDVGAIITHYLEAWHCRQVVLVGYSFGADVLPFVANRLPPQVAGHVASLALLEPSQSATFEIHISNWLPGVVTPGLPLQPELAMLHVPLLCLHGAASTDEPSICHDVPHAVVMQIGRGHHLGGDGDAIVEHILAGLPAVSGG